MSLFIGDYSKGMCTEVDVILNNWQNCYFFTKFQLWDTHLCQCYISLNMLPWNSFCFSVTIYLWLLGLPHRSHNTNCLYDLSRSLVTVGLSVLSINCRGVGVEPPSLLLSCFLTSTVICEVVHCCVEGRAPSSNTFDRVHVSFRSIWIYVSSGIHGLPLGKESGSMWPSVIQET